MAESGSNGLVGEFFIFGSFLCGEFRVGPKITFAC